jgi:hypothetical protein
MMDQHRTRWNEALYGNNDGLLSALVEKEPPGISLVEMAGYVNGLYRRAELLPWVAPDQDLRAQVARVTPLIDEVRSKLSGKEQREIDLAFLGLVRRSSCLSAVVCAGVSKAAGGPLWGELVQQLLQIALEKGHEITKFVHVPDNPSEPPPTNQPDDMPKLLRTGTYRRKVVRTERFSPEAEREARQVLAKIRTSNADTEDLMRGAQLCYDLWGQHLFTHVTGILYGASPKPGPVHEAIAQLADAQFVPQRGPLPGWWRIITYNFDDLMGEALDARGVPRAAYAMRGGEIVGDPNEIAQNDPTWCVPILHLHGYTPRRRSRITHIRYVFSTAQYEVVYGGPRVGILKRAFDECLANPIHLALYVGCSFADPEMNNLLREAAEMLPGRRHFALLEWPEKNSDPLEATASQRAQHEARYHSMGVQPIWFKDFLEIPALIRSLA